MGLTTRDMHGCETDGHEDELTLRCSASARHGTEDHAHMPTEATSKPPASSQVAPRGSKYASCAVGRSELEHVTPSARFHAGSLADFAPNQADLVPIPEGQGNGKVNAQHADWTGDHVNFPANNSILAGIDVNLAGDCARKMDLGGNQKCETHCGEGDVQVEPARGTFMAWARHVSISACMCQASPL